MANSKEYNAKYYQEHKKELSEKKKKAYRENPEKSKELVYKWREKNRERWNAYMRERRRIDKSKAV